VRHQCQYLGLLENVKVRRAGFAYRAPFDRFLRRYKKLNKQTWGSWGEWKGDPREGARVILEGLTSIEPGQWQFGKTKVFIRHPESVFHLEELIERKDFDEICKIQRAWRMWRMRRKALEQKAEAASLFRGNKERRRDSMDRKWVGDYIQYEDNYQMQDAMQPYMEEMCCFADDVHRLNKNGKLEKRSFLLTETAFYLVMRSVKKKVLTYSVTRRVVLSNVINISLSKFQDGYMTIHVSGEHDAVIECDRKTELIMLMREGYKASTGRELPVEFVDCMTYLAKAGDTKQKKVEFYKDEAAIPLIQQQEATKNKIKSFFSGSAVIRIGIPSGLPADTDTTPRGWNNTFAGASGAPAPRGPRGGNRAANNAIARLGGGGMYDVSSSYEEEEAPAPAPVARSAPARGGGGGRALPAAGVAARGGPARGGAARGGPARGGPALGGPAGGGGRAMPAPPRAPAAPARPKATAAFDYNAQSPDELSFSAGDQITILKKDDSGWWEGELNGQKGWIPANYMQE